MSPQPAAPPKPPEPKQPEQPEQPQTAGERQIARAKQLERERADLMGRIASNREYLRLMATNDELTPAQAEWVRVFYPDKEKGEQRSKEEIEATRKAREAARKDGKQQTAATPAADATPAPAATPAAA